MQVDVLPLIPPDASLVLDFRDADGHLGARLQRRNPVCHYLGITGGHLFAGAADCLLYAGDKTVLPSIKEQLVHVKDEGQILLDLDKKENVAEISADLREMGLMVYQALPYYYQENQALAGCMLRIMKSTQAIKPLFIQTIMGETLVCARVRIIEPHAYLATLPNIEIQNGPIKGSVQLDASKRMKILIRQRSWLHDTEASIQQIQTLLKYHYLMIAEMDDDPLHWEKEHRANDFLAFRGCHGVQVSTPALADFMQQFNPEVACFANQLAYLPEERMYDLARPVTIFFGALNREKDWAPLMPIINEVAKKYAGKVRFRVIYDQHFFAALETEAKEFIPFCDYVRYERILASCDIALLPLENNRFNRMKSDLKFIECAGHGVAVLAAPTVYGDVIVHGKTGCIYHDHYEFEAYLSQLIAEDGMRLSMIKAAYAYVKNERLLCQHYRKRYDWYQMLWGRKEELDKQLFERLQFF